MPNYFLQFSKACVYNHFGWTTGGPAATGTCILMRGEMMSNKPVTKIASVQLESGPGVHLFLSLRRWQDKKALFQEREPIQGR